MTGTQRIAAVLALSFAALEPAVLGAQAAPPQTAPGSSMNADAGWTAITHCAGLAGDTARHECTDAVLRQAGLLPAPEEAHRKEYGLTRPPDAAATARPARADALVVTLSAVQQAPDGRLLLTTTDGALWRQVEISGMALTAPAQGQTMTISHGALGSYWCQSDKWTRFRCHRER